MLTPVYFVEHDGPSLYSTAPDLSTQNPVYRCFLEYLNEGGANFVFRILPAPGGQLPDTLQGKLLRLRKDLPHVPSAEDQLTGLDLNFRGLFPPENLVQHELIAVDLAVTTKLNQVLHGMVRPSHRAGDFLPGEQVKALLVTDMTPGPEDILLQLKAKWLAQSPNAPLGARRCRTCAVRAQRASQAIRTATDAQENCPLDLVNPDAEQRKGAVSAITNDKRLRDYLVEAAQPLLQQLREYQMSLDQVGILSTLSSDQIYRLCKAMTLRDCSLFLKRSGNTIEARLGDLDLKQPGRLSRWKKVESSLLNDGWYMNTEHCDHWQEERICLLAR